MSKIFRYYDMRAEAAQPVFPSINVATAIRETTDHISSGRIQRSYAQDFALYLVADDDPITMRVTPLENPKHILDLKEIVKELSNDGE